MLPCHTICRTKSGLDLLRDIKLWLVLHSSWKPVKEIIYWTLTNYFWPIALNTLPFTHIIEPPPVALCMKHTDNTPWHDPQSMPRHAAPTPAFMHAQAAFYGRADEDDVVALKSLVTTASHGVPVPPPSNKLLGKGVQTDNALFYWVFHHAQSAPFFRLAVSVAWECTLNTFDPLPKYK